MTSDEDRDTQVWEHMCRTTNMKGYRINPTCFACGAPWVKVCEHEAIGYRIDKDGRHYKCKKCGEYLRAEKVE